MRKGRRRCHRRTVVSRSCGRCWCWPWFAWAQSSCSTIPPVVRCGPSRMRCRTRVTSRPAVGWCLLIRERRRTSARTADARTASFGGHVNFVDHTTGYHVNSVEITGYSTPFQGSNIRDICGTAGTNASEAQPVRCRVRLVDNTGAPDQFGIRLSNGYLLTTRLLGAGGPGGGKVQLHDPTPSTDAPSPEPDMDAMCHGLPSPSAVIEE